jgi:hypothetical protein
MRELMRARKTWWKEARETMRAEVEAEVDAQPVYQAFKTLVGGKMDDDTEIKLNKESLVKKYGADFVKRLPRSFGRIYTTKGGMDADTAAEFLNFESGDALVEALVGMRDRKQLIEAETDQRMREVHGDMMTDGTIADEAKIAMHNSQRENLLMAELRALRRKQREVAPFVQVEREKARQDRARFLRDQRITLYLSEAELIFGKAHQLVATMLAGMPKQIAPRLVGQPQREVERTLADWVDEVMGAIRTNL